MVQGNYIRIRIALYNMLCCMYVYVHVYIRHKLCNIRKTRSNPENVQK